MIDREFYFRRLNRLLRRHETGQALVELALTVPLLILLLGGAAELGMATYAAIEVSNAAKAAVQYAAMNGGANTFIAPTTGTGVQPTLDSTGMLTAANNDAINLPAISPVTFPTAPSAQCSCSNGVGTSTCTPGDCPDAQIEEQITVYTQVQFSTGLSFLGSSGKFTLNGFDQEMVLQ